MFPQVSRTVICLVFTALSSSLWMPKSGFAQGNRPARSTSTGERSAEIAGPPKPGPISEFIVQSALQALEIGNLDAAVGHLRMALQMSESSNVSLERIREICLLYIQVLQANNAQQLSIHVSNVLGGKHSDKLAVSALRALAYGNLEWEAAKLDELRRLLQLKPGDIAVRRELALELLFCHTLELRNPQEADALLTGLESLIAKEPLTARLMALAASETGDFDRATALQRRYLNSLAADDEARDLELSLLTLYQQRLRVPRRPVPSVDPGKIVSVERLADIARKSMVVVRFEGEVECVNAESGQKSTLQIHREHVCTVLDIFGTFLVSSDTVRRPRYDEVSTHPEAKGTTRWLQPPRIEILSKANPGSELHRLGTASLVGTDEASGLAILEFQRKQTFHFAHIGDDLEAVHFIPAFREVAPEAPAQLARMFELVIDGRSPAAAPKLNELAQSNSRTAAYCDWTSRQPTMARLTYVSGSQGPVGTPIFNLLGECVGITQQIGFETQALRQAVLPASVCTRIAARLAADGTVTRAQLPFVVGGVQTGEKTPASGMLIYGVTSQPPLHESLVGKCLLAVDGVPTPTMTEWLVALERVASLGLKTVVLDVYDRDSKLTSKMTVAVGE